MLYVMRQVDACVNLKAIIKKEVQRKKRKSEEKRKREKKVMGEILVHAGCFVGIILLGYVLRNIGFFA